MTTFAFENLLTPQEFHDKYPNVFGSVHGVEWFIRQHKKYLIESGALVYIQKRKLLEVQSLGVCAYEIAKKNSALMLGEDE